VARWRRGAAAGLFAQAAGLGQPAHDKIARRIEDVLLAANEHEVAQAAA
jgi:hypothetical protein